MPSRRRLDAELVRRGLASTRSEAQRLIAGGGVSVAGRPRPRPATLVAPADPITVGGAAPWASRAGEKLAAALDGLGVEVAGRRTLDVGASTGGFTDVLLASGAASVAAVDVGYGQMVWRLRTDPRVTVFDRTNFRRADVAALGAPFDLVVVDVSFISVALLADNLARAGRASTDYLVLVKPQFEAGRGEVEPGGVVHDPAARRAAVASVAAALEGAGIAPQRVVAAAVRGAAGNQEYVLHGRHGGRPAPIADLLAGVLE